MGRNRYQIFEKTSDGKDAGCKAPMDVAKFAEEEGFTSLKAFKWGEKRNIWERITGQIGRFLEYLFFFARIQSDSILLLQFPFVRGGRPWRKLFLESITKIKKVHIVTLIHDLNELRNIDTKYQAMLVRYSIGLSSVIIVHNERMAKYLEENGIPREKMLSLEVFDYESANPPSSNFNFERSLTIAGNLASSKCGYLSQIDRLKSISINLFGTNYHGIQNDHIKSHGGFSPDGLPTMINTGFGLVWDGDSIDTCEGSFGTYLKYNNPHKFSLYIAAGIPVVAWRESALAEFIEKNRAGLLVSSLQEAEKKIMEMADDEYAHLKLNVFVLAEKIRSGFFTKRALEEACEKIQNVYILQ